MLYFLTDLFDCEINDFIVLLKLDGDDLFKFYLKNVVIKVDEGRKIDTNAFT